MTLAPNVGRAFREAETLLILQEVFPVFLAVTETLEARAALTEAEIAKPLAPDAGSQTHDDQKAGPVGICLY
jgi:hypothetical protein